MVDDGEQTWTYGTSMGAIVQPSQPGSATFGPVADPSGLVGTMDFTIRGHALTAGRTAIAVRGTEREPGLGADLAAGADHHDLFVDLERGVVLRCESMLDDEPFRIVEVVEIAFDETFPAGTCTFEPPPGVVARAPEEAYPPVEHITLEEAARLAPFTVLAPTWLPQGAQINVTMYMPERDGIEASVFIHWMLGLGGLLSLDLRPLGTAAVSERGERLERDGQTFEVGETGGQGWVAVERSGTAALLRGNLELGEMIRIASSLQPAPTEPPALMETH
jgi:hypothetical protein